MSSEDADREEIFMTLTEFLVARITEDEAVAERAGSHNGGATFSKDNYGCLLVQPSRVLAECEAKRRIMQAGQIAAKADGHYFSAFDDALRFLALPYADHPDYREEWRPYALPKNNDRWRAT